MRISGTKGVSYNKLLQEERVSVSRSARPKYQTSWKLNTARIVATEILSGTQEDSTYFHEDWLVFQNKKIQTECENLSGRRYVSVIMRNDIVFLCYKC